MGDLLARGSLFRLATIHGHDQTRLGIELGDFAIKIDCESLAAYADDHTGAQRRPRRGRIRSFGRGKRKKLFRHDMTVPLVGVERQCFCWNFSHIA